ncbi:hypothetical protein OHR68_01460 [Spirillospora sp. NBC_00431]
MAIDTEPTRTSPLWTWNLAGRALRLVMLLILLACGLLMFTRAFPQEVTPAHLHEDLREGRVDYLEMESGENAYDDGGQVRWSSGLLTWQETWVPGPDWGAGLPRDVRVTPVADLHDEYPWWKNRHPAYLAWGACLLWLAMLAVTAARPDHRYAGRWSWFWMYTVGLSGALLYLLLEPHPLWKRGGDELDAPRRHVHGATGLLAAALLGLATLGLLFGLRAIVH